MRGSPQCALPPSDMFSAGLKLFILKCHLKSIFLCKNISHLHTLLLFFSALLLASLDNRNRLTFSIKYKTKSINGFMVSTESSIVFFSFNPEILKVKIRAFFPSGSSTGV